MRARVGTSVLIAASLAIGIAGCTFVTPIASQNQYDPSDGVSVTVGDVKLLNAIVITDDGKSGNLVVTASNSSDEEIDVRLQYDVSKKHTVELAVPGLGESKFGTGKDGQAILPGIDTQPGSLLPLYVQYGSHPGKQILVPVLNNSLAQYRKLTPSPTPTPTPTPTASLTPTPTPTPKP